MINPRTAQFLRDVEPQVLVEDYNAFCSGAFDHADGVPVLIAARNEAHDLPATLISLALSEKPVSPVVIENGSHDETASVATRMGAVLLGSPIAAKMAALQYGVSHLRSARPTANEVLFTDADTLVGPRWASRITRTFELSGADIAAVLGVNAYAHGNSTYVDVLRSLHCVMKDAVKAGMGRRIQPHGPSMALRFDSEGQLEKAYTELDTHQFVGEEKAICDQVLRLSGHILNVVHPDTLALTRADRINTIRDGIRLMRDPLFRVNLYNGEYGKIVPYASSEPAETLKTA